MSVHLDASLRVRVLEGRRGDAFELRLDLQRTVKSLAFFGPSGAGKTLAIRALAGLIQPESGALSVDGETWSDAATGIWRPPHERQIGYVPQSSALFTHLSLLENICFGLEPAQRSSPPRHVHELIERMNLERIASDSPVGLSGGERQRVSLARALARSPRLLLLDEPMSALDDAARAHLRRLLHETIQDLNIATILVTHDAREAAELADEVLLFERGRSLDLITADELRASTQPVWIEGEPLGPPEALDDGRVRVQYERVTITADPGALSETRENEALDDGEA